MTKAEHYNTQARDKARQKGLLTQKDLCLRWNMSIRTVQRERERFGLEPVDFYGNNPLFTLDEVEKMEEARRLRGIQRLLKRKRVPRDRITGRIVSMKELRAAKPQRNVKQQHAKAFSSK